MEYPEILSDPALIEYAKRPLGSTTTEKGFFPASNGEGETGLRPAWSRSMEYAEMLPNPWPLHPSPKPQFATKTNLPVGSTATPCGSEPVPKRRPGFSNVPSCASTLNAEIVSESVIT